MRDICSQEEEELHCGKRRISAKSGAIYVRGASWKSTSTMPVLKGTLLIGQVVLTIKYCSYIYNCGNIITHFEIAPKICENDGVTKSMMMH